MFGFEQNNAIDLGYAMSRLVQNTKRKNTDVSVDTSELINDVVEGMEEELSVARYKKLKELVNKYFLHNFLIKLACRFPKYTEIQIIEHISLLSKDEFFSNYLQYVIESKEESDEKIKEAIVYQNKNNTMDETPSFTTIKFLKRHSEIIRDDLVEFLEYFLPILSKAKSVLEKQTKESLLFFNEKFNSLNDLLDEFKVVEENIFEEVKDIRCYVMAFAETSLFIEIEEDICYIMLGIGLKSTFTEEFSESQKNQYFRCLGEPVKVKILELLKEEKLCAIDLVRELDLNKSTISHHISQLLSVNLLIIDGKVGRKIYYSVNVNHMRKMFDKRLLDFSMKV